MRKGTSALYFLKAKNRFYHSVFWITFENFATLFDFFGFMDSAFCDFGLLGFGRRPRVFSANTKF